MTTRRKPNREYWDGPARVLLKEGTVYYWLSHCGRIVRCHGLQLRHATDQEE